MNEIDKLVEDKLLFILSELEQELGDNIGERVNIEYLCKPVDQKLLIDKVAKMLK